MADVVFLETAQLSVPETEGTIYVPIKRTGTLEGDVTVTFATNTNSAIVDVDFLDQDGQIVIPDGVDRVLVPVTIINDSLAEGTESFNFSIVSVTGADLLFPRTALVSILDDEQPGGGNVEPPLVSDYDLVMQSVVTGLAQPIAFEFDPSGQLMFVAEKGGIIKIYDSATGTFVSTFIDLSAKVNDYADRGLLDIALHPDFATNHYVYAFYVVDPADSALQTGNAGLDGGGNRYSHVVRFTADPATGFTTALPGSEVILLGGAGSSLASISGNGAIDSTLVQNFGLRASDVDAVSGDYVQDYLKVDSTSHAGGSLAFGPDGALYISVGDGTSFDAADPRTISVQSVGALAGKILRVDPLTGDGLADNPFHVPGQSLDLNESKVWQLGLRNPYAIAFDQDGNLFISETGWFTHEEINKGGAGANFGWPFFEGGDGTSSRAPIYESLPEAQAFYAAVQAGQIVVTPSFRAFAHASSAPGFQVQAIVGSNSIQSASGVYPAEFANDYFFTDIPNGELYAVDTLDRQDVKFLGFTPAGFGPVHMKQGPDGYVYYADLVTGEIGRFLITADPVNSAPIAVNDLFNAFGGRTLVVNGLNGVLANDTDTDIDTLRAVLVEAPLHGVVAIAQNGAFTYTPNPGFSGVDSFTYRANDGSVESNLATVDLAVAPEPDPLALSTNGTASYDALQGVHILTLNSPGAAGSAMSQNRLDVRQAFSLTFEMYLGANDGGADGAAFVLHDDARESTTIGTTPGGSTHAARGITNGIGIEFDTYDSSGASTEPSADHSNFFDTDIAAYDVAIGQVTQLGNIEDGQWHIVVVTWNGADTLTYSIDGVPITTWTGDLSTAMLGGSDFASFGFTAATGGLTNLHMARVTALTATLEDGRVVDVSGGNRLPVGVTDSYATAPGTTLTINAANGVLGNDLDPDLDPLTAALVIGPAHGALALAANGSFVYTPTAGFVGTDTFSYRPNDGANDGNPTTVSIVVAPPGSTIALATNGTAQHDTVNGHYVLTPDSPGAAGSVMSVPRLDLRQAFSISFDMFLGTNDGGADGAAFVLHADSRRSTAIGDVTQGSYHGARDIDNGLGIEFDTYRSTGSATELAADHTNLFDTDNLSFDGAIGAVTPLANLENGQWHGVVVTWNGVDTLSYSIDGVPITTWTGDLSATFLADSDFATFGFTAASGGLTNLQMARLTALSATLDDGSTVLIGGNAPPVADNDAYAMTAGTTLNVPAATGVLNGDTDANNDPLTSILVTNVAHGTLALAANGGFVYTPTAGYVGTDTFTYRASDAASNSNLATVTITVAAANTPPVAVADAYEVERNGTFTVPIALGVLGNDTDGENNALTAILVASVAHGTLTLAADGSFAYTPTAGYAGPDSFTYRANDGIADSLITTVTLGVIAGNLPPVAAATGNAAAGTEDVALTGTLPTATDPDGDIALTYHLVAPVAGLTLDTTGSFTYVPPANVNGNVNFQYVVRDQDSAESATQTFVITLAAVNDAPVAALTGNTAAGTEDVLLTGAVPAATDVDGTTPLTYHLAAPLTGLTLNANGTFSYQPPANANGNVTFNYVVRDPGGAESQPRAFVITLTPVNDAPVAVANSYAASEDTTLTIAVAAGVRANDSDVETAQAGLTTSVATGPANGTLNLNPDGSFTYTPNANFAGIDTFIYRTSDGVAQSTPATVTITVAGVNDAPVLLSNSGSTWSISVNENIASRVATIFASDIDSATVNYRIVGGADAARFLIDGTTGALSFVAPPDFEIPIDTGTNNTYNVIVEAYDAGGATDRQSLAVRVLDSADAAPILGTANADTLNGTGGSDLIESRAGNDRVLAQAGNDLVRATIGDGTDYYSGGAGTDTYSLAATAAGATVNLATGTASSTQTGTDTLVSIENVIGSTGADTVVGGNGANRLEGAAGNDTVTGGAGADTFVFTGAFGVDRITDFVAAGTGHDWVELDAAMFTGYTNVAQILASPLLTQQGADVRLTTVDGNNSITFAATTVAVLHANLDDFHLL